MRAAPAGAARAAPWTCGAPARKHPAGLWPRAARCPSYAPFVCRCPRRAAHCPAAPALAWSGFVNRVRVRARTRVRARIKARARAEARARARVGVGHRAACLSALSGATTERRAQVARRTGELEPAGLGLLLVLSSRTESSICSSVSCGLRVVASSWLLLPSLEPRFLCARRERCWHCGHGCAESKTSMRRSSTGAGSVGRRELRVCVQGRGRQAPVKNDSASS